MRLHLVAALCAVLVLPACGGGGGGQPDSPPVQQPTPVPPTIPTPTPQPAPQPEPTPNPTPDPSESDGANAPAPTAIGTPRGQPASAVIGAGGGTLLSADGMLRVDVPANAFAADQTVSIQEITNEAHGAKGRAYRINPEGLHTPIPMTVSFKYTDEDLRGTTLDLMRIAYQDANRVWRVYRHPVIDTSSRTLSVQTKHFSDWSAVTGAQILPHSATVHTGETLQLQVVSCEPEDVDPVDENGDINLPPVPECKASPLDAYETSAWSVNGVEGGSFGFGIVQADSDRWSGRATYTAPVTKPQPNTVSVSAKHTLDDGSPGAVRLLVANITIEEDEVDEPAACDTRLFSAQNLRVDVSFDGFNFTQSGSGISYRGNQAGRLVATLTRRQNDTWMTCLFDGSACFPLTGQVSVNDTIQADDTTTIVGNGTPHEAMIMGSFIGFTLHPETCTFDLNATFRVASTFTSGKDVDEGYWGGVLVLKDQPIAIEAGALHGSRTVNPVKDTQQTGYVALDSGLLFQTFEGSTTARWTVTPAE